MIKYLFFLPCLLFCFSNAYGQCFPTDNATAAAMPGAPHVNPAGCDVDDTAPDPAVVVPNPTFDCANVASSVTFETPIIPDNPSVFFQYWGECATGSPDMPSIATAANQGYIQQMFCNTVGGLPAFPLATPVTGTIPFIPQDSEDVGCDGFATGCDCGNRDNNQAAAELYQLDFWLAVPSFQSQIGIQFSGARDDAASAFVGPDLNNMCEIAYFKDGSVFMDLPNQPTGTYNIPDGLSGTCGLSWLRVRIYVSDIADRFRVNPEVDLGSGFVNFSTVLIEPATAADDNIPPTIATSISSGYLVTGTNGEQLLFNDDGTFDPLACNPVASTTNTGICMCDDAIAVAPTPLVVITDSECIAPATIPSGGVVAIPTGTCPDGSTLEYSIDGVNFTDVLPMYDQSNPITVTTRCVCNIDPTVASVIAEVTTTPGECCNPDCGTFPANGN